MSTLIDTLGKGKMDMWKKILMTLLAVLGCFSAYLIYFNMYLNAATLNTIQEGEKVIVGANDGNEITWTISKDNGSYYTMYHSLQSIQMCNNTTNNYYNGSVK